MKIVVKIYVPWTDPSVREISWLSVGWYGMRVATGEEKGPTTPIVCLISLIDIVRWCPSVYLRYRVTNDVREATNTL